MTTMQHTTMQQIMMQHSKMRPSIGRRANEPIRHDEEQAR